MKTLVIIFLIAFILFLPSLTLVMANPYSYNLYDSPVTTSGGNASFSNDSLFSNVSNFSEVWITNVGNLDNVNSTQFTGFLDELRIDITWLTSFGNDIWCKLTGCTMSGNINMNSNNLINVQNITLIEGGNIKDLNSNTSLYFEEGVFTVEG